ncbi:MAG: caspase family protein [Deltaproteobacteria bacterium]|nr:caspase family protein [Deltaproteobacteria bacterium]
MSTPLHLVGVWLGLFAFAWPSATAAAERRFAVVIGNDRGAASRAKLWFAEADAARIAATLIELGEFEPANVELLRGQDLKRSRQALARMSTQIGAAVQEGDRTLLVVYYSGHADNHGVELGNENLSFADLKELVQATPADIKIVIVDACEAGLLTQVKGAAPATDLGFALPPDETAQGVAYIASTAVGESAQESAAIGGSFFSHHLEAGLRGAADLDNDGRVTLNEAFHYTSAQTVARTAGTAEGPQHPTYDFRMAGRADVVLTDLGRATARVLIPAGSESRYLLRGPRDLLVEVTGGAKARVIAVPPGTYDVERRSPIGRATGSLDVDAGDLRALPVLVPTRYELARAKGGPKPGLVFAGGGIGTFSLPGVGAMAVFTTGVRKEVGPVGVRVRLEAMYRPVTDQDLRYELTWLGATAAALLPANTSEILVEVGPQLGYAYIMQRLENQKLFSAGALLAGGTAYATAPVGPLRVGLDLSVSAAWVELNDTKRVRFAGSLGLLVLMGF